MITTRILLVLAAILATTLSAPFSAEAKPRICANSGSGGGNCREFKRRRDAISKNKRTWKKEQERRKKRDRDRDGEVVGRPVRNVGGRIYVPTNNPFQPYKIVARCPRGWRTVVSNWPKKGDMMCKRGTRPHARGPLIWMPTNNKFQPYKAIGNCPKGYRTVLSNWPQKGDMTCKKRSIGSASTAKRPKPRAKFRKSGFRSNFR